VFEYIKDNDTVIALIISHSFAADGIHFFTAPEFSQQLAYMHHPVGKKIQAHVHNPVAREVFFTQEVLFIKKGKLRVDLYNKDRKYLESRILMAGDIILLASGGHGFEVLDEVEMFEVKQGPHTGEQDKTRFSDIDSFDVIIK
jgi:mannose-6-phosphate isomerase-like protein (cupin superfamily)